MTPLNLYVESASAAQVREALDDYGLAIKQLAAANIFPGDMLLKNFGVTRHGRVVFLRLRRDLFPHRGQFPAHSATALPRG